MTHGSQTGPAQQGGSHRGLSPLLNYREYSPSVEYVRRFRTLLTEYAYRTAFLIGALSEVLWRRRGGEIVLTSIARAGIPVGILVKRWLDRKYGVTVPHFAVGMTDRYGIDGNAVSLLSQRYMPERLQFIDGWTSRGSVQASLISLCSRLDIAGLDPTLAVIADPGSCTTLFATRDDVLIPHACLGALDSGLLSRSHVELDDIKRGCLYSAINVQSGPYDDLTNSYLETVTDRFEEAAPAVASSHSKYAHQCLPEMTGASESMLLAQRYAVTEQSLVRVGVCETSRALFLRKQPHLLLVNPEFSARTDHLLRLANERNIPVSKDYRMRFASAIL